MSEYCNVWLFIPKARAAARESIEVQFPGVEYDIQKSIVFKKTGYAFSGLIMKVRGLDIDRMYTIYQGSAYYGNVEYVIIKLSVKFPGSIVFHVDEQSFGFTT